MTKLVLSFSAATGLGLGLWKCLSGRARLRGGDLLLAVSAAVPLGLGLVSIAFFLWATVSRLPAMVLLVAEIALAILLIIVGWFPRRNSSNFQEQEEKSPSPSVLLSLSFLLVTALAAYGFICRSLNEPHGRWDAWGIWNLRARFLFWGGEHWRDGLSPHLVHPDYPLMIPGMIAAGWAFAGGETTAVPIAIAFLFTFATTGALVGAVWSVRGRTQGLLAGLLLLGTPLFVLQGASQYADVPMAYFMLASLILLHRANRAPQGTAWMHCLAGLLASMGTWTKNEGLLFFAALLVAQVGAVFWKGTWTQDWKRLAAFCAGALPVGLLVASFKLFLAPPNDLISGQTFDSELARLSEPSRYLDLAKWFAKELLNSGKWNLSPVVLPFYGLLAGLHTGGRRAVYRDAAGWDRSLVITWSTLALAAVGLFLTYLLTPLDLTVHLATSLSRVLLQLWPSVLLASFLTIRSPDEV